MRLKSNILKLALFATGLSGIVAEYILSTLATYFLGDSVMQWTMTVSIMLFSMGIGSRLSKYVNGNLLMKFIFIEFLLSVLVSYSSLIAYTVSAYTIYHGAIIYTLSIAIGILIGLEIPLVVRLNDEFEELKINVSSVLEKDYFGSLVGGVFFAFVGLPYLGLTYTPFVLGMINFLVALLLLFILWKQLSLNRHRLLGSLSSGIMIILVAGFFVAKPIILHGEQKRYKDKIVYEEQTRYQKLVITQWKNDYWLFINGNQQLSTLDEVLYHEPIVHPAMKLASQKKDILILGGGDGCTAREVLKYSEVKTITLVDLDPGMTRLASEHPILVDLNSGALKESRVNVINEDGYQFLEATKSFYDIVIIDLPDPRSVELGRLYTNEFYTLCYRSLRPNGIVITQAGSPYYATKAFRCIEKTVHSAGFSTIPLHNQIITLGEWGWVLGVKSQVKPEVLKRKLQSLSFEDINVRWINNEAMQLITSFGKDIYSNEDSVKVNRIHDPVLYHYYLKGNWELY